MPPAAVQAVCETDGNLLGKTLAFCTACRSCGGLAHLAALCRFESLFKGQRGVRIALNRQRTPLH